MWLLLMFGCEIHREERRLVNLPNVVVWTNCMLFTNHKYVQPEKKKPV